MLKHFTILFVVLSFSFLFIIKAIIALNTAATSGDDDWYLCFDYGDGAFSEGFMHQSDCREGHEEESKCPEMGNLQLYVFFMNFIECPEGTSPDEKLCACLCDDEVKREFFDGQCREPECGDDQYWREDDIKIGCECKFWGYNPTGADNACELHHCPEGLTF